MPFREEKQRTFLTSFSVTAIPLTNGFTQSSGYHVKNSLRSVRIPNTLSVFVVTKVREEEKDEVGAPVFRV